MPIEIKELYIKTVVENEQTDQNSKPITGSDDAAVKQDKIIAACVEQVMEIFKNKNER